MKRIAVQPEQTVLGTTYYDAAILDVSDEMADSLVRRGVATYTPTTSDAARALRAIPSEARSAASRENGKRGGRPRRSQP